MKSFAKKVHFNTSLVFLLLRLNLQMNIATKVTHAMEQMLISRIGQFTL